MSAPSPRQAKPLHETHSIEELTTEALEAAQAGDWDRVDACYTARGISLATGGVDRTVAQRLVTIDEQVRAAVLVAQAAISGQLGDAAQVTRHLRRLRESSGPLAGESGTMHHEA